jgi:hypothetical protein
MHVITKQVTDKKFNLMRQSMALVLGAKALRLPEG